MWSGAVRIYLTAQYLTDPPVLLFSTSIVLFPFVSVQLRSGIIKPQDKCSLFFCSNWWFSTRLSLPCSNQISLVTSTNVFTLSLYVNKLPVKLVSCLNTPLRGQLQCVSTESTKGSLHLGCPSCSVFYILAGLNDAKRSTLKSTAISLFSGGYCRNY